MSALFNEEQLADLRSVFVRTRLAEDQYFGNRGATVSKWIEGELVEDDPSDGWLPYIAKAALESNSVWNAILRVLLEDGDEFQRILATSSLPICFSNVRWRYELRDEDEGSVKQVLFGMLNESCFAYPKMPGGYLVCRPNVRRILHITDDCKVRIAKPADILGAMYYAWKFDQDPYMSVSRKFLCDWLRGVVSQMRTGAEADFDNALAVKGDGTKIISSPFVFVYSLREGVIGTLYTADEFKGEKLRRPSGLWTDSRAVSDMPFIMVLALCGKASVVEDPGIKRVVSWLESQTSCDISCAEGYVLCVSERHCPSPLPDTGRVY